MVPGQPSTTEAIRRERVRGFALAAALIFCFSGVDFVTQRPYALAALGVRLFWSGTLALQALFIRRSTERSYRYVMRVAGFTASASATALVWVSGGCESPYFPLLFTIPLATVAIAQDALGATVVASATTLAGVLLIVVSGGSAWPDAVTWSAYCVLVAALGSYSSRSYYRLRRTELGAAGQLALSERRRSEAERLAMVGRLSAGLAHEVFNPLAFIKANLDFLRRAPSTSPAPEEIERLAIYAEMNVGVERIQQIISDLRNFARSDDDTPERVDVTTVLDDSLRLANTRLKGVARVFREYGSPRPPVSVNRHQLSVVFLSLLLNAGEALEGRVPAGEARIWVRVEAAEGGVRVAIEDNGPGLPPGSLSHVFEPFFTTKPPGQGTGLGLSLAHEYVGRFGGQLVAENRSEGGARFTVELPAAA